MKLKQYRSEYNGFKGKDAFIKVDDLLAWLETKSGVMWEVRTAGRLKRELLAELDGDKHGDKVL